VRTPGAWLVVVVLVAAWLALGALTAAGALRRGQRRCLALVTGLFFPVAWVIWYMIDERPLGQADGSAGRWPSACRQDQRVTVVGRDQ
jgi:hypothetical protein